MPRRTISTLPLAVLLAVAGGASAQQIYKWKDANGVWQYSNRPPPNGVETERLTLREAPPPPPPAAPAPAAPSSPTPQQSEIAKRKAEACARARQNVATMRANRTVSIDRDGDGIAEQQLSEAETAEQLRRAEAQVTLYCE